MNGTKKKALVLNIDYTPMTIETSLRAFVIIMKGHATKVKEYDPTELTLKGATKEYSAPSIIRVNKYYKIPYRRVPLTRENIFKRDGYECQYCGSRSDLTIDHIIPRAKGGKDVWNNVTTACKRCNNLKADNIIDTDKLKALKAHQPHSILMMQKSILEIPEDWTPYLFIQ